MFGKFEKYQLKTVKEIYNTNSIPYNAKTIAYTVEKSVDFTVKWHLAASSFTIIFTGVNL